jgi:hypothetical protein
VDRQLRQEGRALTRRIPLERRAEAAVLAWLRHRTTAYDRKAIPRVKGGLREARRLLAARSLALLDAYRRGDPVDQASCPLRQALAGPEVGEMGPLDREARGDRPP